MLNVNSIVVFLFSFKYFLDFCIPDRTVNFVLFNFVCFIVIFLMRKNFVFIKVKEIVVSVVILSIFSYWAFLQSDFLTFYRYSSLLLIYFTMRLLMSARVDLIIVTRQLLSIFLFFVVISLFLSVIFANPGAREFYNFEHANLMGSYILLSSVFLYYLMDVSFVSVKSKINVVVMAFLSTSTGAFLASLLVFFDLRRLRLRTLIFVAIGSLTISIVVYLATKFFSEELHMKIFGIIYLLLNSSFEDLSSLAKLRLPIQELGDEYSSSMIWRFYAYLVFYEYIFSQEFVELLFGNGFGGHLLVWDGIAPHNDFIFMLVEFGVIFSLLVIFFFVKTFRYLVKYKPVYLPLFFVLVLRLMFENNIVSYYLLSGLIMHFLFLYLIVRRSRL